MAEVTNGKVSYTRQVRPADYESKACTVELSFTLSDGEDFMSATEAVAVACESQALARVGLKAAPAKPANTETKEAAAARINAAEKAATEAKPKRPPATQKAEKPAEPPKDNPAAMPDETPTADPASMTDDELLGADSAPEVTDAELTTHVTRKNAALQPKHKEEAPKMIRKLIAKYVGAPPKGMRDIPKEQRRAFLAELDALS